MTTAGGGGGFDLARRKALVDPSTVDGRSWQAEALKAGCQDFVASVSSCPNPPPMNTHRRTQTDHHHAAGDMWH